MKTFYGEIENYLCSILLARIGIFCWSATCRVCLWGIIVPSSTTTDCTSPSPPNMLYAIVFNFWGWGIDISFIWIFLKGPMLESEHWVKLNCVHLLSSSSIRWGCESGVGCPIDFALSPTNLRPLSLRPFNFAVKFITNWYVSKEFSLSKSLSLNVVDQVVCWHPDRAVQAQALSRSRVIVFCCWARH